MQSRGRNSEAAQRSAERRRREDEAPRLRERVPALATLRLEIEEHRGTQWALLAHEELTAPIFHGSPQARDLGTQIEEFGRETVTAGLHSLSGGPG